MDLILNRKTLADVLAELAPLAGKNKRLPIFDNIKFVVKDNDVRVQSSDGDRAMRKYISAISADSDGEFLINCNKLSKLIAKLDCDNVAMAVADGIATVKYHSGKMKMPAPASEEYPDTFVPALGNKITIPSSVFINDMMSAIKFVGTDEYRPQMKFVHISVKDGKIHISATDTHALYHSAANTDVKAESAFFIDPMLVGPIFRAAKSWNEIDVYIDENQCAFQTPDTIIFSAAYNFRYPDVMRVIPKEAPIVVSADRKALVSLLERVGLSCEASSLVVMRIKDGVLTAEADNVNDLSQASESMPCIANEDITFGINKDKLCTILSVAQGNDVSLCLRDSSSAILIMDDTPVRHLVIMPMSIEHKQ